MIPQPRASGTFLVPYLRPARATTGAAPSYLSPRMGSERSHVSLRALRPLEAR